jgi:hypothetical protein
MVSNGYHLPQRTCRSLSYLFAGVTRRLLAEATGLRQDRLIPDKAEMILLAGTRW